MSGSINSSKRGIDFDVLVVGAGISGLIASISLLERGTSILLIEKRNIVGGVANYAVGSISAADTSVQTSMGIKDDHEDFLEDIIKSADRHGWTSFLENGFARLYANHSNEVIDWLVQHGIDFAGPYEEYPNRVPRLHNIIPNSHHLVSELFRIFNSLGGKLVSNSRATSLIQSPTGKVDGVEVIDSEGGESCIKSRHSVILATGSFSSSKDLLKKLVPKSVPVDSLVAGVDGDGIRLAINAGGYTARTEIFPIQLRFVPRLDYNQAETVREDPGSDFVKNSGEKFNQNMDKKVIERTLSFTSPAENIFRLGAILVNKNGQRFVNETSTASEIALATTTQPQREIFALFDSDIGRAFESWPNFISTFPGKGYAYLSDYEALGNQVLLKENDLKSIAEKLSIPYTSLDYTIRAYNKMADQEVDIHFKRSEMKKLTQSPFYALGPIKPVLTVMKGGVVIDSSCKVLHKEGSAIKGLYAIGDGTAGPLQVLHGMHIGWSIMSALLATSSIMEDLQHV